MVRIVKQTYLVRSILTSFAVCLILTDKQALERKLYATYSSIEAQDTYMDRYAVILTYILRSPDVIPDANNTSYNWCATPNISPGNTTLDIMQHCCPSLQVQNTDGCAWCYVSYIDAHNNSAYTDEFVDCFSSNAKRMNVSASRIYGCNTPNLKGAAATKEVSVWKVGVVALLLGVASLSL